MLVAAVDLIGWHFWGGRGEVLKPNEGPVVTVTDFGLPLIVRPEDVIEIESVPAEPGVR